MRPKEIFREVRPNLIYDVAKWVFFSAILAGVVVLYRWLRSLPSDLVLVVIVFGGSFMLMAIAFIVSRYGNKRSLQQVDAVPERRPPVEPQLPFHELQKSISIIEELNRRWAILRSTHEQQLKTGPLDAQLKEQALEQARTVEDFIQRNFAPDPRRYVTRFLDDEVSLLNPMPEEPREQFLFWVNNRCNRLQEFLNERKTRIGVIR